MVIEAALLLVLLIVFVTILNKRAGIAFNLLLFAAGFVWFVKMPVTFKVIGRYPFLTQEFIFRTDILVKFFGLLITGFAFLTGISLFNFVNKGRNIRYINILFAIKVLVMILVVLSFDLLSFYLFWELMSLVTFLILSVGEWNDREALKSAYKYILMSVVSSFFYLIAALLIFKETGSFKIEEISLILRHISDEKVLLLTGLMLVAFFTKFAAMPFHTWLPDAYANTITPYTAYVAAVSTRIGIYGMLLWFFEILGQATFYRLKLLGIPVSYLFAWVGALTMVIPTFTALMQDRAKKLMTWHGIGQGGYMMVGLAAGGALGFTGSIFHILNHGLYIALLFISVGAVIYRTGTDDLNKLGGLIKKMPLAFLGTLIGIIGLAGIPPLNGFVSKWFLYRGLIQSRNVFLAEMAFLATLGTILSVYKYIHNIFLGRLPEQYKDIKGTPVGFAVPIWALSFLCLFFGIFPGVATHLISQMQVYLGLKVAPVTLYGISNTAGNLNMLVVGIVFFVSMIIAGAVFYLGGNRRFVDQNDNYAAGEVLTPQSAYHYSARFYAPLYRLIEKPLKPTIDTVYIWIANKIHSLGRNVIGFFASKITDVITIFALMIGLGILYILKEVLW